MANWTSKSIARRLASMGLLKKYEQIQAKRVPAPKPAPKPTPTPSPAQRGRGRVGFGQKSIPRPAPRPTPTSTPKPYIRPKPIIQQLQQEQTKQVAAPRPAPRPATPIGITIPTGEAAKGKQVRIGGTLYPSQEWYDVKVAGEKEAGVADKPTPTIPIKPIDSVVPTDDLDVTGDTPDLGEPDAPLNLDAYTKGLAQDLTNKRKALDDVYAKQIKDIQGQKTALEKKIADLETKQEDVLTADVKPLLDPFRKDLEDAERKRLKIEENYFANQKSVEELDSLLTQAMAEIEAAKEVTGLTAIRSPRVAKLQEDMAARVGVIEAVMAARNNQITVAENLIDRSISAIEADRKDQLTYYESILSFYEGKKDTAGNKLISLSKDERDFLNAQIGLIKSDLDISQVSVDYIKELLLDPKTANLAETAGIKLTDNVEQVNAKLSGAIYKQDRRDIINTFEAKDYDLLTLPAQWANKPESELTRITDSKGKELVFWKKAEVTEPEKSDYMADLSADKAEGMTYDQAISIYGANVSLDHIDRLYRKGKYYLEDVKITETEETKTAIDKLTKEVAKWEAKYQAGTVHKIVDGNTVKFTKPNFWLSVNKEKVLYTYTTKPK